MTFGEDAATSRTGRGPVNLATIRAAVIAAIKDAGYLHIPEGRPRPFGLPVTTWSRMTAETAKAPPPDCRRIVMRLRCGVEDRCRRRTTSTGESAWLTYTRIDP